MRDALLLFGGLTLLFAAYVIVCYGLFVMVPWWWSRRK